MNIRPSAAIRQNYNEIAELCRKTAEPVFLTKNGRGRYAIVDMEEYERTQAVLKLMGEIARGEQSGKEKGWTDLAQAEKELGVIHG